MDRARASGETPTKKKPKHKEEDKKRHTSEVISSGDNRNAADKSLSAQMAEMMNMMKA